jgi:spermidine/putrescine transport system permease protein
VALLTIFTYFKIPFGLITLIIGHTLLGLGFAFPLIYNSFVDVNKLLIEASLDLGASMRQTFFKVILPILYPALFSCALLIFILSLDDFLISFFCAGPDSQTLSLYIFAMIRGGLSPTINALSTIILVFSSILVSAYTYVKIRANK